MQHQAEPKAGVEQRERQHEHDADRRGSHRDEGERGADELHPEHERLSTRKTSVCDGSGA